MGRLHNLRLGEFSIVRGSDKQPANPEAVALYYKAQPKEGSVPQTNVPAEPKKKSLPEVIGEAIHKALSTVSFSSTDTRTYNSTEKVDTPDAAAPAPSDLTVHVVADAVAKIEPAPAAAPAAPPVDSVAVISTAVEKALKPVTDAVVAMDGRLAKLEGKSTGSRQVAKGIPLTDATANGERFPDFTKFLRDVSRLSPGQKLTKSTITSSGWSYGLSVVEAGQFIDYIVDQSTLLKVCRTVAMPNQKYFIDKIGLGGNVLVKGTPGVDPGDTVSVSGPTQVELDSKEVLAIVSIGDDTLEDNIEGDAFVQHLLGMISRAAANELEQMAIHGDTDVADAGILDRLNGWYKLAKAAGAHVIEAMGDDDRYWPGVNAKKATRLLKALPSKYRQDTRNLRVILPGDLYLDYNDELSTKGFSEAWQAITGIADVPVRSVQHVKAPLMKTDMEFTYGGETYADGAVVALTNLQNLIFGIHRQIKLEPYRQPRKRCTDYVLSMRCAANIENGDGIAIYDHALARP